MAITISGENNNDRITAQDGVIDTISGFNIAGIITASSFTGDLTGNVTGNLTGNVNSTSPLLLQTGGSERFRITGNNELGIAGANYGSSGQVLTSGGSGSAVSWTTITETTINNNADNRVITGTGSANTLNAESNVHVDGSGRLLVGTSTNNAHANADNAVISGTGNIGLSIMSTDSGRSSIYFGDSSSSPGSYAGFVDFVHSNNSFNIGRGNDNSLTIDSIGRVLIGTTTAGESSADELTVANSGHAGMTIRSGTSSWGSFFFSDGTSGGAQYDGAIEYKHNDNYMRFRTAQTERLRIASDGRVYIGNTQDSSPYSWNLGLQVSGTSTNAGLSLRRDQSGSGGALLMFVKTGGALNGNTAPSDGDQIGGIYFNAADGTDVNNVAARISGTIDGTPGSNDTPGRLTFATTADGANSPTERLRIASNGDIGLGTVPETDSFQPSLYFAGGNANIWGSGNANLYTAVNARYTGGGGWKYNNNGLASYTAQQSGTWEFRNAPSGTADNVATFTTRLRITSTGALQHTPTSGVNYFTGTGEYVFGSASSSPPAGGSEANVQIHASKTRAQFSINAYMSGNAGGPFMQFLSSRSGTVGTLGGKVISNDYLGEIRFSGDNGTNYNSVAHGASIWARAKSTPADGDTVIRGELNFNVGNTDGTPGVKNRLTIQHNGRIKFIEDDVQRNSGAVDNFSGDGAYMQHYVSRNGSTYRRNFDIASVGDGSWGSSIRFSTNPDSNSTTSEAMRINHLRQVKIGGTYTDTSHQLLVDNGSCDFKGRVYVRETLSFYSTPFGANVTYDTGISVNAGGYGGSILAICSRNYGSGTNTQSGLYLIKFHYDGNNTPQIIHIAGTNMATFGQSGSNTLTVAMGASNNMFTAIESSVG